MKRILVVSYSQSGQLNEIIDNFLKPFESVTIERVDIIPEKEFVFPWSSTSFFDTMPDTVLEKKINILPFVSQFKVYDLIIFGYQPWFLSPSLPATALLLDPEFLAVLNNTPVVTVIGARNMWINSQKRVVQRINDAGGRIVANIPFIDRHQNLISALSILHWMLTAKKNRKWGILPLPGVSDKDIKNASILGLPVHKALQKGEYNGLQQRILESRLIDIHPSVMFIEMRAKRLFVIWANLIVRKGTNEKKRAFWVALYKYYLFVALFFVSPIVLFIYNFLIKPLTGRSVRKNKELFLYLGIVR